MKLCAVTPVFREASLLTGCIECLKPFVDTHIVCVSTEPYYGGSEIELDDGTADLARELGAEVIEGKWPLDHMQRNTGIALLDDCDWIICTDVDMWMTKDDMCKLIDKLSVAEEDAFVIKQKSYWKDVDHCLVGDEFKPVIAIRPFVRFIHIGNIDTRFGVIDDIVVHHLNWCYPKDILKKVKTYPHAPEFNGELWYETHYKNWSPREKIAVLPTQSFQVAWNPIPSELREYL